MEITEERHGAITVLRPNGPLVGDDAAQLRTRLEKAIQRSLGRLVVDGSSVAYLDSAGLEALYDMSDVLAASGQSLRLVGINETVREVFDLTDTASRFECFSDVQSAVRSFL
jgi:anti-anti-sigma factor